MYIYSFVLLTPRYVQQSLQWTLNGVVPVNQPSPSTHPSPNPSTIQLYPKNVCLPQVSQSNAPLGTAQTLDSSPSKSLNTSSKPFEPFPPVTNGNSGGSFLFSSTPARNLPEANSRFPTADFYTPRKSSAVVDSSDIDISSPGESPLPNNDSPDLPPRRTQYEKIQENKKYRDAVRRRRIQKPKRYIVGSKYESESEDEESHRSLALSPSINEKAKTTSTGSFLTSDPDLPYVASGYVQLVFNMFLVGVALYLGLAFIRAIQRDVNLKVEEYSAGMTSWWCVLMDRNLARNGGLFERVFGESMCPGNTCASNGESLSCMGKVYESGSYCCW